MQVNIYSTKFRIKSNEITFPQNAVNVDTLTDDMVPSQSQVGSVYGLNFHSFTL